MQWSPRKTPDRQTGVKWKGALRAQSAEGRQESERACGWEQGAALRKGDQLSYPKSWSSSASPSDPLHRSEGARVLIFPSRDSALPIRPPHVCLRGPWQVLWGRGREVGPAAPLAPL